MELQDCIEMLREIKDAAFSTVDEGGAPQVRVIDVMLTGEGTVYFCTARGKAFYRELINDGRVAVVGMNREFQMVRISGKARKLLEQKKWIDRIFEANTVMNDVYPGNSRYVLEPFCIHADTAEYFDLNRHPIYRESFAACNRRAEPKGFRISTGCIGCGSCAEQCPQMCIDEGEPYQIRQNNCLHCGLCSEVCPVKAIERRKQS